MIKTQGQDAPHRPPLAYDVRLASLALQRVLFLMVGIVGVPLVAWVSTVAAHVSN